MDFYQDFLEQHKLPASYADNARKNFEPVAKRILELQKEISRPYFVALNGCQGSGKSTLADYLVQYFNAQGRSAIAISLDDFYLTKSERQSLAASVHPLFETRGVPGTHDVNLMQDVLTALAETRVPVSVPRFNKAVDDRFVEEDWSTVSEPMDIVILEGWFWGARHQPAEALEASVNALESESDADGIWRNYVNDMLKTQYEPIYLQMDCWLMLQAPSFDCVYQWRLEQEQKLLKKLISENNSDRSGVMSEAQVARFIQFYQRITEQLLLTLPEQADVVWQLKSDRSIHASIQAGNYKNAFAHAQSISHREGETQ